MKSLVLLFVLVLLETVYSKNAWELGKERSRSLLRDRAEKAARRSIVSFDKTQMSADEIKAEKVRLQETCNCDVEELDAVGVFVLKYSSASHPSVDELGLDASKENGADDALMHAYQTTTITDPSFSNQWALQDLSNNADINIAEGWQAYLADSQGSSSSGPSVIVGVIDSGVQYTHPDLKNVMWNNTGEIADNNIDDDGNGVVDDIYGADYISGDTAGGDPMDVNGHGTHCAGIIRAEENNGEGVAGVASFTQSKVKIMACKGLGDDGGGTISSLLSCLNYVIANGATISSNSWGSDGWVGSAEERVWGNVLKNNPSHLFIAAAGNSNVEVNDGARNFPCGMKESNILCVASSTSDDALSSFSNYGTDYIHVVAPGSSIYSTYPNDRYKSLSGTSMACPQVSGLAALIRSMRGDLTGAQVRELIEANVQKKADYATKVSTGGLIDVGATIKAITDGTIPEPDPEKSCKTIKIRTEAWGYENSYAVGSCESTQTYGSYKNYEEGPCCLNSDTYNLVCKCSWGDGWHGGYVEIDGVKYCEDFTSGSEKYVSVTF